VTDRVRIRATVVLVAVLSLPTVRALVTYDIDAMTAAVRILLAIAVAIAAVAVVGAVIGRVPPPGQAPAADGGVVDGEPADTGEPPIPRPDPEPAHDEPTPPV
jgi:hypothetical protein